MGINMSRHNNVTGDLGKITLSSLKGAEAEQIALEYLVDKGFVLLTRNFGTRRGEIDLIMNDGDHLVFVEVRFRRSSSFGSAEESITKKKCLRLTAAALSYMQINKLSNHVQARFDAVAVKPDKNRPSGYSVNWIKNILTD
jgi:putative endonuclease